MKEIYKKIEINIHIALMFLTVIFVSFIPDTYHVFFGDWFCELGGKCPYTGSIHLSKWHWGFRHWMWLSMGISLFIYNCVMLINKINKYHG